MASFDVRLSPRRYLKYPVPNLMQGLQSLVPFHKLTQWLCYSLLQVLKYSKIEVEGEQILTALPEYRNGIYFK